MPLIVARRGIIRPPRGPFSYPGTKPGFDPSHLASGTMVSGNGISAIARGTTFASLLSGIVGSVTGVPTSAAAEFGPAVTFTSNSSDRINFASQSTAAPASISFGIIARVDTLSGSYQGLVTNGSSRTNLALDASGNVVVFGSASVNSLIVPSTGIPYFIAASFLSATKGNFVVRNLLTGRLQTAEIATAATISASTGTYFIGNNASQTARSTIAAACISNDNFLSVNQLIQWSADPWAFWYPR